MLPHLDYILHAFIVLRNDISWAKSRRGLIYGRHQYIIFPWKLENTEIWGNRHLLHYSYKFGIWFNEQWECYSCCNIAAAELGLVESSDHAHFQPFVGDLVTCHHLKGQNVRLPVLGCIGISLICLHPKNVSPQSCHSLICYYSCGQIILCDSIQWSTG